MRQRSPSWTSLATSSSTLLAFAAAPVRALISSTSEAKRAAISDKRLAGRACNPFGNVQRNSMPSSVSARCSRAPPSEAELVEDPMRVLDRFLDRHFDDAARAEPLALLDFDVDGEDHD